MKCERERRERDHQIERRGLWTENAGCQISCCDSGYSNWLMSWGNGKEKRIIF